MLVPLCLRRSRLRHGREIYALATVPSATRLAERIPFINPATLLPYPIVEDDSRFTRFQPKIGAEFTVPLCDHGCWGMSTYLGADYSFDVGGSKRVTTLTPGGFPAWSQVNPGNVTTIRAGFQLDLHTGF